MANKNKTPDTAKPPSVPFDDILTGVHKSIEIDNAEAEKMPKKYNEGEGIEQPLSD